MAGDGAMNAGGSSAAGAGGGSAGTSAGGGGAAPTEAPLVFVGGSSEVRSYRFEPDTGVFTLASQTSMLGPNPSYFAVSPDARSLLIANETDDSAGGITATLIAPNGELERVNHTTGPDGGFTFVALSPNGHHTLAASYNGGSVSVFNLGMDGIIGVELDNRDFGAGAQTHGVAFDPSGEHVFIPNKGNDEIAQLSISGEGTLTPNTPAAVRTADGAGPRHIAMHPSGNLAFVINELDSTMVPYQVSATGTLTPGTPVSTLPSGFTGQNTGAHVELRPDGKYVYGSNRGHDSIVAFSTDQTTGALTLIEHEPSRGRTPRDFDMDPGGRFIVVANQQSSQVAAFRVEADGKLTALGDIQAGPAGAQAVQIVYVPR
jgi:6-phosphogluconolactonase